MVVGSSFVCLSRSMKKLSLYLLLIALIAWVACGIMVRFGCIKPHNDTITIERVEYKRDTILITDTLTKKVPVAIERVILKEIPIETDTLYYEQAVYQDSDFIAYVSGIEPQLDSIKLYPKTLIIHDSVYVYKHSYIQEPKKKLNFGLQFGYGATTKGMSPYVGLGITFRF